MADSTVLWSEVDSSGGDGQRDCNGWYVSDCLTVICGLVPLVSSMSDRLI